MPGDVKEAIVALVDNYKSITFRLVCMFLAQCFTVLYTGDSILLKSGDSFKYWNGPNSIREKVIQCWEVER